MYCVMFTVNSCRVGMRFSRSMGESVCVKAVVAAAWKKQSEGRFKCSKGCYAHHAGHFELEAELRFRMDIDRGYTGRV